MNYPKTLEARFLSRPNRFVAQADIEGLTETVHVKNTGRCKELLLPGSRVILAEGENPKRRTKYDLVAVYKENLGWVNIDSQAPNAVMKEYLESGKSPFGVPDVLRPEYSYGKSRVDFYMEKDGEKILLEVKGCTLELCGVGYFPDAPTERGVKHLRELAGAAMAGYRCYAAFVIALPGVRQVLPNMETHPEFGRALSEALRAGVQVLYLPCRVEPAGLEIGECIFADAEELIKYEKGFGA